jgi:antitoxin VapB
MSGQMAVYIRDKQTEKAVRDLAAVKGVSMTEAVRNAAEAELKRVVGDRKKRLEAVVAEIQARLAEYPKTGLKADKAFYDWLSGDE